jgi:hypothetical protein
VCASTRTGYDKKTVGWILGSSAPAGKTRRLSMWLLAQSLPSIHSLQLTVHCPPPTARQTQPSKQPDLTPILACIFPHLHSTSIPSPSPSSSSRRAPARLRLLLQCLCSPSLSCCPPSIPHQPANSLTDQSGLSIGPPSQAHHKPRGASPPELIGIASVFPKQSTGFRPQSLP